jgi:hypothetical protein
MLTKEVPKIMPKAEEKAAKIKLKAQQDAEKALKLQEKSASDVESAAKKEASKLTKQAGTEASAIRQAAEDKAKVILAGTTDSRRVRDIIFGKNRAEFEEMSRIVLAEPKGKEQFAKAVGQVIADKAQGSLSGAIKDWKYISDDLVSYGLMSKSQTDAIAARLQEIYVAPASLADKMSFTQRLINNAILGYAIPRPVGEIYETVRGQ